MGIEEKGMASNLMFQTQTVLEPENNSEPHEPKSFEAAKPDPRVYLCFTLSSCLMAFLLPKHSWVPSYLIAATLISILAMLGGWRGATKAALVYIFVTLLAWLGSISGLDGLARTAVMLRALVCIYAPPVISAAILARGVRLHEAMTVLERMKLPRSFVLPLSVAFRYLPTLRLEISCIRTSLSMRKLSPSLAHPLRSLENFAVPVLMRSLKISEELSRSALSRGYGLAGKRSSFVRVALDGQDYALLCLIAVYTFAVSWLAVYAS